MSCPYQLVAWDISGTLQNQNTGLLYDGMMELLEALNKAGVAQAICTDLGNRRAHAFVEENRIGHLINSVQHTGINAFKPEPDMLKMAMIECDVTTPHTVCMVGDSACDIALAHTLKTTGVYAAYGSYDASILDENPHHVVRHIDELKKLLKV